MTDPIARFDWQAVLRDGPYASFPEAGERPVIGITANYGDRSAMLTEQYYKAVVAAGGTPVLIPPVADTQVAVNTLARVDGLLLSGGADINTLYAGEEPSPTGRYPRWASAGASRCWPWRWGAAWSRTSSRRSAPADRAAASP